MVSLEQLACAALAGEALTVRSLAQDWLLENSVPSSSPRPQTSDPQVLAVAAALVELFAERMQQAPPSWCAGVGPCAEPRFLVKSAANMKRLRAMCEAESPGPLRKRNLFAPADYLRFA